MKISIITQALAIYDANKGYLRGVKDESHIQELREFHAKLLTTDADLTPAAVYELVVICLKKQTYNGSASCKAFEFLFEQLGGKNIYIFLQHENLLDETAAFFIMTHKNDSNITSLIYLLVGDNRKSYLSKLFSLDKDVINLLSSTLMFIHQAKGGPLPHSILDSCFAASLSTLATLKYLLTVLRDMLQLNESKLRFLFANFEKISNDPNNIHKRLLDHIRNARMYLTEYFDLVVTNGSQMEKIMDLFEEKTRTSDKSDAEKELLFKTLLTYPQWYERIFAGVAGLTDKNTDFYEIVLSLPEHAYSVAKGVEQISQTCPSSPEVKTEYASWVKRYPHYSEDLTVLVRNLRAAHIRNLSQIICRVFGLKVDFKTLLAIVRSLAEVRLLDETTFGLLLDKVTPYNIDLIHSKITKLVKSYKLDLKKYTELLNNPDDDYDDQNEDSQAPAASEGPVFGTEFPFFGRRVAQADAVGCGLSNSFYSDI